MEEKNIILEQQDNDRKEREIKLIVKLLLRTNSSFENLSRLTKLNIPTIEERLNDEEGIVKVFSQEENTIPEFEMQDGYSSYGEYIFSEVKKRTDIVKMEKKTRIDLSKLYSKEESQMKFLAHVALTYRLTLASLSELLGMDEDMIFRKLLKYNPSRHQSFLYAFNVDFADQEEAKTKFVELYKSIFDAKKSKDKDKIAELLSTIDDSKFIEVLEHCKKRSVSSQLANDKLIVILKYQLKYALSYRGVAKIFKINPGQYNTRILELLESEPELKLQYEHLADYNRLQYGLMEKIK